MKLYGEILILILVFIANVRVFFVKEVKRDPLVILAPVAFLLALLLVISWGVDTVSLIVLALSLLVMLTNFHALFRYAEGLYVDHYSVLMKVWAFLTCIPAVLALVFTIIFAPVEHTNASLGVVQEKYRLTGSFSNGFDKAGQFQVAQANIYKFKKDVQAEKPALEKESVSESEAVPEKGAEPAEEAGAVSNTSDGSEISGAGEPEQSSLAGVTDTPAPEDNTIVLLMPDRRGDTKAYLPYLQFLAQSGFTVFSCDFYTKDCRYLHNFCDIRMLRPSFMLIKYLHNKQNFEFCKEFYTYNISLEIKEAVKFLRQEYPDYKIFLVSDSMTNDASEDFYKDNKELFLSHFCLDSIPEYNTPGLGFVEMTNPLVAVFTGNSRDSDGFYAKYAVKKTAEQIRAAQQAEELKKEAELFAQNAAGTNN